MAVVGADRSDRSRDRGVRRRLPVGWRQIGDDHRAQRIDDLLAQLAVGQRMAARLDVEPPERLALTGDEDRDPAGGRDAHRAAVFPATSNVTVGVGVVTPAGSASRTAGGTGAVSGGLARRDRWYERVSAATTVPHTSATGMATGVRFGTSTAPVIRLGQYHRAYQCMTRNTCRAVARRPARAAVITAQSAPFAAIWARRAASVRRWRWKTIAAGS